MKKIVFVALVLISGAVFPPATNAQRVKLRSNISPACTGSTTLKFADIHADGNIAVMGSYNCRGVFIFDVSNPDAPTLASWYNPGANLQFLEAIVIGNRGYFGTGSVGGVHIVDLTNPASPQLLGIVNATNGGGHPTIHEMMVFDRDGRRYLLENSNSSSVPTLRIIDVTTPNAAVLKWQFSMGTGSWVHAMHIRGDRMYLSGFFGTTRIDIYNIANLGTQAPALLGSVNVGSGSNHSAWTSEDGNYLYSAREVGDSAAANPGDIRVYDVSNPTSATLVKRISMADLGIVAVSPHNPVVMGNKLYVAWYQAGTLVFDIADPANPVQIGRYDTWPAQFTEEDLREVRETNRKFDPDDIVCGVNRLSNQQITGYNGNWAVFPFLGEDKVLLGDLATGLYVVSLTAKNDISDFDGDGKTDFASYTPTTGAWRVETSSNGAQATVNWGIAGDVIAPGDYDGDGKSDRAIFRPSTGTWWFIYSSNGSRPAVQFGTNGDIPVSADYDGDGKTDSAVFRPSDGIWYISLSTGPIRYIQWGIAGDKVFTGDHDGDGKADQVVWRPSTGVWYVLRSSNGTALYNTFGTDGDRPLLADFDGDAKSDFVLYRPSTGIWYWLLSTTGAYSGYQFGIAEDIPIPADYDGDGKSDIAVFRPSTNTWYRVNSNGGNLNIRNFGQTGDEPTPASVQP
ncbi:MAG: hypothetical protein H0X08_02015 [Blastocatellia bacterium]|nr:hypothetical protein [Blastocatellia bacterium]